MYKVLWIILIAYHISLAKLQADSPSPFSLHPEPILSTRIQSGLPEGSGWSQRIIYLKSPESLQGDLIKALGTPDSKRSPAQHALLQELITQFDKGHLPEGWTPLEEPSGVLNRGMNTERNLFAGIFVVQNDSEEHRKLIFENNATFTRAVSLFALSGTPQSLRYLGSCGLQNHQAPALSPTKNALFPIELSAKSQTKVILFMESYVAHLEPKIFNEEQLADYLRAEDSFISLASGFLFCVLIYNLFLWIAFRDRLYLVYTGFVAMSLSFVLGASGTIAMLLRHYTSYSGELGFTLVYPVLGMVAFGVAFGDLFNETLRFHPQLKILRNGLLGLVAFNFPCYFYAPHLALQLQSIIVGFFILYILFGVIRAVGRGNAASRIFLVAWCSYLLSGVFNTLAYKGLIQPNFWTEWGAAIGLLIEGIGLSIAISFRLKRQEEELHRELQSAMNAKVLLTNDLVHRTTQPLRKALRAVDGIKKDLRSWEDSLIPNTMNWQGGRAEHMWLAQQQKGKYGILSQQIGEIEAGILHTEHTIEDIYALSSPEYETSGGATLRECWKQLLLRLSDSSMRADLERLKVQGDDLPKFEIRNNAVILNLALEMVFKLWLATGHGPLYLNFSPQISETTDELHIRVVQPFAPISHDLLDQLLKHINYILFPYAMKMETSPTGWELKISFYKPESHQWKRLKSA